MTTVLPASRRIFSHPAMVAHMVMWSALNASLMLLAFQSAHLFDIIISFAAGWILWTFTEYALNRWLLHTGNIGALKRHHARHHKNPEDIRYSLPHPLVVIMFSLTLLVLSMPAIGVSALSLTSGFLFGCCLFCMLHVLQHHYPAPAPYFLKASWQNHFLHHHRYPNKAFGVSTHLWDRLFGTLPPAHLFLGIQPLAYQTDSAALRTILVDNPISEEVFLNVSEAIHLRDPHWIPYIKPEIRSTFDPASNPYFKHGVARRWILVNAFGEVVGRIAAFMNFKKMYEENTKVGCIGFFECVNDREAAFLLFNTAIQWLVERYQVSAIDGPVNFGENDKYWGLLINGFTAPSYGMNYNPPYYQNLFEAYGFKIQYRQITTRIDLGKPFPERMYKIAQRVIDNKQYRFVPFCYAEKENFITDFVTIYNQAWASFKNFQPMDADVVRKSLADMKTIMDESVIWFAYAGEKAVGFVLAVPDVNEIVKYAGGKFNIWGKLKFLLYKYWKGFSCLRVVVMGIVPEFQQRGLESGLIVHAYRDGKTNRYKHVQLAWVGDFNDKMIAIHKAMGATEEKQHATFRKDLSSDYNPVKG